MAPLEVQPVQPVQQQPLPSPVPPPPSHQPMETIFLHSSCSSSSSLGHRHIERPPSPTSDDVDMHDILAGGPNRDAHTHSVTAPITLQPKPATRAEPEDDSEVITSQPVMDETDAATSAAAASPAKGDSAASPDLALRRAAPAKKFPCCTIV
ncbi:hypothetical protein PMAYCL1PPCAC_28494 [Pristionchus mayeri]|uniref:Uncharacterized protein n=1 Tax=Pristionchus mayeri TaxID=1317129 RepID=A0AAN5DA89_9BILA|nr:hypothetical protein PMAYCL1PPCAC_28494 [Pristionchus mayeri]